MLKSDVCVSHSQFLQSFRGVTDELRYLHMIYSYNCVEPVPKSDVIMIFVYVIFLRMFFSSLFRKQKFDLPTRQHILHHVQSLIKQCIVKRTGVFCSKHLY